MKPLKFKEHNVVISESQDQYTTIFGHHNPFEGTMTTGFKLSKKELSELNESGGELFIKLKTFNQDMQAIMLSTQKEELIDLNVDKYVIRSVKQLLDYIEGGEFGDVAVVCANANWERIFKYEIFPKFRPIGMFYKNGHLKLISRYQETKGIRINKVCVFPSSKENRDFMNIMDHLSNRLI